MERGLGTKGLSNLEMVTDLFLRSDFQIDKKRTKKKLFLHGKDL